MTEYSRVSGGAVAPKSEPLPSIQTALGKRILVVEDSPSARKLMQQLLLRLGVSLPDLRLAATVPEALQLFTSWEPQIAIVDLQLRGSPAPGAPGAGTDAPSNGDELVLQLLQRNPGLKVIICSASESDGVEVKALIQKGRVLSMIKPVVASKLAEVLSRATQPSSASAGRGR
ncbi:MAG: response regulator [Thermoplasmata archaeon]|nr:response regulator [Thermoplasmata archaeon]